MPRTMLNHQILGDLEQRERRASVGADPMLAIILAPFIGAGAIGGYVAYGTVTAALAGAVIVPAALMVAVYVFNPNRNFDPYAT